MLDVDPDNMEKLLADKPYYSSLTPEPSTYPGQDEEILIGSFSSIFVTHKKTDNKVVYGFLKAICDYSEELKTVHPTFNVTEENITEESSCRTTQARLSFLKIMELNMKP
ncbi:hypothetical protein M3226_28520 [Neobacillus cucumis]|uniref:TAXI family TRAP transporter solute-binding subunit n=1 Tax=Neobacillus cucumis TaxID=1740721 RepID=UPI00203A5892|nr:TAXI family TRAP transporter solute-binding subunit [Neobacillus cucumis]MCM3729533.1 hypothetical protein [Neobacillus cucumis]